MVARSTPDRKVACSSHVVVNFDDLLVVVVYSETRQLHCFHLNAPNDLFLNYHRSRYLNLLNPWRQRFQCLTLLVLFDETVMY